LPDVDVAISALATARDWDQLRRLYDSRRPSMLPLCPDRAGGGLGSSRRGAGSIAISMAQALLATGARDQALALLTCVENGLALHSSPLVRVQGFSDSLTDFARAQTMALRGRQSEALWSLDRAVDEGWIGLYGDNLRAYPAFDSLPTERLRPIQQKLNRRLARERAEIQRFCRNCN
jgi:hypothetical protein